MKINKSVIVGLLFVGIVIATMFVFIAVIYLRGSRPFVNEPLHSTLEAFSSLSAIMMGLFLLSRKQEKYGGTFFILSIGFFGMGLLEGFHAFSMQGQSFVLLRITANLVGGFCFALILIPYLTTKKCASHNILALGLIIIFSISFWLWNLILPETLPVMVQNGKFTFTAKTINFMAGLFFVAASGKLLFNFYDLRKPESYILACIAVLFGLASLTFTISSVWDASWWFWHGLRLLAYFLVLSFIFRDYLIKETDLRKAMNELKVAEKDIRRLYSEQQNIANVLQQALLTVPREISGIEFGHIYESATEKPGYVGGDFYDIFELESPNKIGIVIGDVSGKGIEAAKLTGVVKDTIRAFALSEVSPALVIKNTRKILAKTLTKSTFITVFFAVLDKLTGDLTYCNGGHPPGIIKRKENKIDLLETLSAVISSGKGLFEYVNSQSTFEKGDILVLYTDGVTEARHNKDFYGQKRLVRFIKDLEESTAKELPKKLIDEVINFSQGMLRDDIAILSVSLTT